MKHIFVLMTLFLFVQCKTNKNNTDADNNSGNVQISSTDYSKLITSENLKTHLYTFASDDMEGRMTGEPGQKKAAQYLKDFYKKNDIAAAKDDGDYYQTVPESYFNSGRTRGLKASENVAAFIEGTTHPEEVIVISAHYDHVGVDDQGNIYNGADDDGSGTVAILEIAKAFAKSKKEGNGPKRSLLFLHVTAEEVGLVGSRYYSENPIFPLENTITNLNIDMIGRITPDKKETPNYIYLIGSDKLSQELHDVSEQVAKTYSDLELDYKFNADDDPNRFYYRSDHYNFAKHGIPVIFYFNGVHEDYHQPTDTADKIEYDLLAKRAQLIFHTAWEVANRKERIKVDINE